MRCHHCGRDLLGLRADHESICAFDAIMKGVGEAEGLTEPVRNACAAAELPEPAERNECAFPEAAE